MSRKNPVTTITLTPEAKDAIESKTRIFGGSVASFASYWATTLAQLPDDELREVQMLVAGKIERLRARKELAKA